MRKRVLLFVLASVLMPFCIFAQYYSVKGSVWDYDTAEPINSVAVSVYQITGNDTIFCGDDTTDENGSFSIGHLKAGNYVLHAKSDNHFNTSDSFTLSSENVKDLGKITMRAGKGELDPAIAAVVAKIVDYFPENVYVDLGLSVKWAICNVGAYMPEGYGDLFAWGETDPISERNIENYKYSKKGDNQSFTKYCTDKKYGYRRFTDNKTTLDPGDDAAHVKWSGDWRMPTIEEFQELIDNCTCTWDSINGVKGIRFTSNVTGYTDRSIFLPAAGGDGIMLMGDGSKSDYSHYFGNYWSSTLEIDNPDCAKGICFFRAEGRTVLATDPVVSSSCRDARHSIRPVTSQTTGMFEFEKSVNSNAYQLPEGESIEDLIRRLPNAETDEEGSLYVNGKKVQRILNVR